MAYCMAMVLIFFKVFRMDGISSLNLSSSSFIDKMCVVATLAPVVITMSYTYSVQCCFAEIIEFWKLYSYILLYQYLMWEVLKNTIHVKLHNINCTPYSQGTRNTRKEYYAGLVQALKALIFLPKTMRNPLMKKPLQQGGNAGHVAALKKIDKLIRSRYP